MNNLHTIASRFGERDRKVRSWWGCALGVAMIAAIAGCESSRQSTPGAEGDGGIFKQAKLHDVQTTPYQIDPPDELTVHAPKIKEIDGLKQQVRSDGTISLNLLGNIKVAGLTVDQVTDKLKEAAKVYYIEPDIKIEVTANSKFYFVYGTSVNAPGKKPYTGHDTVVSALAEAGFNYDSWPQQVLVSRPPRDGRTKPATVVVDFTKIYDYGDVAQNYVINEGDIITVRPSPLTKLNQDLAKMLGPLTGAGAIGSTATSVAPSATPAH